MIKTTQPRLSSVRESPQKKRVGPRPEHTGSATKQFFIFNGSGGDRLCAEAVQTGRPAEKNKHSVV